MEQYINIIKFNIIGAGRLGINLANALIADDHNQLISICNMSVNSTHIAIARMKAGKPAATIANLPDVNLTFITTPDDSIANIAAELANNTFIKPGHIVAHCSGVLTSDVLQPLKSRGCLIASIHPLKAFSAQMQDNAFQDCNCMIEGDHIAVEMLTSIFTRLHANVMPISPLKKSVYHAATVISANYIVTLAQCAIELFMEAGCSEIQSQNMTQQLMQSSLNNLKNTPNTAAALTGPLARGDINTIQKHLNAITTPHVNTLYKAAALATLPLTELDPNLLTEIQNLLCDKLVC